VPFGVLAPGAAHWGGGGPLFERDRMARVTGCAIIEAPSVLGLFPSGVEHLPDALLHAGLVEAVSARRATRVSPPPYDPVRDSETGVLNLAGLRQYTLELASAVAHVLDSGDFPLVLGGDCSIVLGSMLALRRRGRYGLLFLDGHADFYQPEAEPSGEAASMDLALVTGRGPAVLTDFVGGGPLVVDADVVQFGQRDAHEAAEAGSQRIEDTDIHVIDLAAIRRVGVHTAANDAVAHLTRAELDGFWIHLDCDVLDDAIMPAVDYRQAGGLGWDELVATIQLAVGSGRAVGLEITIFNPRLDEDGSIASALVRCIAASLESGSASARM
jgi:arginase